MNRHILRRSTRRAAIGAGLALGVGAHATHAQTHPDASPMADEGYARPELLVNTDWLRDRLDDPTVRIVALMPVEPFARAAIPGAGRIDWPDLEITDTSDASLAAWQVTVEDRFTRLGLTREQTIVVYDEGTLFAARLWWVLHYLGHEQVAVLDGGLPAWIAAGHETVTDQVAPEAATTPYVGVARPEVVAQVPEVEAAIEARQTAIVDARTTDEYAAGHIPGAVNVNYPLNSAPEEPKFWKPANELQRLYAEAGLTAETPVIPYCSTGVRSAVTAFTLRLIGYDEVALFTGSWAEWTLDPNRPVTTGDAP